MTNGEIFTTYSTLMTLRQDDNLRLPARTSFALLRNIKLLQPIVEDITVTRTNLLERYGTRDEKNPDLFTIEPSNQDTVREQLISLDGIQNDVTLVKIKLDDLSDVNLSIQAMEALEPLLEEES